MFLGFPPIDVLVTNWAELYVCPMDPGLLSGFLVAAVLLALMPGPDNIYVLTESISKGARQGISITTGLVSGVLVHTLLAATGLSLLVFRYDVVYHIVKFAGAAYLLYLSYQATKEVPMKVEFGVRGLSDPFLPLFKKGFLMNVLNPKVSIFFIALLPQFVSPDGFAPMIQMSVLGVVFMVQAFIVFSSIALIAGSLASLVTNERFWATTKWIKVIVLAVLGILLALSGR